jgi:AraC-like DNA-binding protein
MTSCYTSRSEPGHTVWSFVDFDLRLNGKDIYLDEPFYIMRDAEELLPILHTMASPGAESLAVKGMLFSLLANMIERMRAKEISDRGFFSIYEAVKEIERHPERNFSVHELARLCYLSDTGFREKFKRFTGGIAPIEYRNRLRIQRANSMLKSENFTLENIAEQLGFWDAAHFCRVYKSFHGHAPRHLHEKTSNER